jgi:Uma2 family endonuclease
MTQQLLNTQEVVSELDISHLVTEDDAPVDNLLSAQQQRLLIDAVCSSKALPLPFVAEANVGLFHRIKGEPIVPDVLLSLGVQRAEDFSERRNRSYFVWEFGKIPDVCIEIVSNQEGDEINLSQKSRLKGKLLSKKEIYAQIGVSYYVVFDPLRQLAAEMNGAVFQVWALSSGRYVELPLSASMNHTEPVIWLENVGLGLTLWAGEYEEAVVRRWLRWCDRAGNIISTGAERADRLAKKLREFGVDPDEV